MKDKIYRILPNFMQGLLISLYNYLADKDRYGSKYRDYFELYKRNANLSLEELYEIQKDRFHAFLYEASKKSPFYKDYDLVCLDRVGELPIVKKEDLRQHINQVYTLSKSEGIVSKTGGTTGKSLEVLFTKENMQERFALLDEFRNRYGYRLGKKTAWFSGKSLLSPRDIKKNRFWKTDIYHKVRYYSTFHIKEEYLKYYVEDLIKYQPEYFVGFPSTILEIAKYGLSKGYDFPKGAVKAIFPTAETITPEMRETIETFFKTKMYNQYASSEGAPFIFECEKGNLHLELQSGVFEVLDENDQPTNSGRLVVTSFTNEGTPLIRYDIGDSITLEDENKVCDCGNKNPLVKEILGRMDDYIYSPENGKINIINIANAVKDVHGVINYKVIQNELNKIVLQILIDKKYYSEIEEQKFIKNWKDRVGEKMIIKIEYVESFDVANSGK